MGINVGAALGTILVGYLGQTIGWGYGFGLAGIGMVAGPDRVRARQAARCAARARRRRRCSRAQARWRSTAIGLAAVAVIWALIQYQDVIQTLLIVSGIALLGYVLYESFKLPKEPRERMFAILFLIALNPLFWGLFEQAGGSMNLFTDRFVDRGGVPASHLPVDQPDLHHPARAGVRRAVAMARQARAASRRRRPSSAWRWSQIGLGHPGAGRGAPRPSASRR